MAEHRVPLLGGSLRRRRHSDPDLSPDLRVQAVLAGLRAVDAPAPRAHFRAELRAQLVAVAPRIVAEGEPALVPPTPADTDEEPARSTHRAGTRRGSLTGPRAAARHGDGALAGRGLGAALARPLRISAATLLVLAFALGGAVWLSRGSLPGDALYGLKRASENVQLATASGSSDKAKDYLRFAGTRVREVKALLAQSATASIGRGPSAAGGVDAHTAELVTTTLNSADADVRSAAALLGKQAVARRSSAPLGAMTSWAPGQRSRLTAIAQSLPSGALRQRVLASASLVTLANERALGLAKTAPCGSAAPADQLGPQPGAACARSVTPKTSAPTSPGRGGSDRAATKDSSGRHTDRSTPTQSAGSRDGHPASTGSGSTSAPKSVHVPISTPHLPITGNSCGIGLSLGPIGATANRCTPSAHVSLTGK